MNDIKWREERHLNVDGMNRIAQSMKRWMSIAERFRQDTHTTNEFSVSSDVKEPKDIDRCAL